MDTILRYTLAGGQARAFVAKTTELTEKAKQIHGLSHVATAALGRTLTCAAMMGIQMKGEDDTMTATLKGDGPMGGVTVVANSLGHVKGYVGDPCVELPLKENGHLDVGGAIGHFGRLTVVKDLGMKEPYVGNVLLQSGEVAEDFAYYFTVSEQTPSAVALGVLMDHGVVASAGGVILQPMPGCSEEVLRFLELSAPLLYDISAHFVGNSARDVGELLFAPIEHELVGEYTPEYKCDCSRDKFERALISLGAAELTDIIETQHGAELTCHFCNKKVAFSEEDLLALIREAT